MKSKTVKKVSVKDKKVVKGKASAKGKKGKC